LFNAFSEKLGDPLVLRKNEYYKLAKFVPESSMEPEVVEKLDLIAAVAGQACPLV